MKFIRPALWIIIAWWATSAGWAQSVASPPDNSLLFGLTPLQMEALRERWLRGQPVVALFSGEMEPVAGQPIQLRGDSLFVYPLVQIPVGPDWRNELIGLSLRDLDSIALQNGGPPAFRQKRARFYRLSPEYTEEGSRARQTLRNASVYQDTLVHAGDLQGAFKHSKVLRRIFPNKHVRFSLGVSAGRNVVTDDIVGAIENFPLSGREFWSYGSTTSFDWLDVAFRVKSRYMLGYQYFSRPDYSNVDVYYQIPDFNYSYLYRTHLKENRLYAEYALLNVDRYFSRPFELTLGAGYLFARPEQYFQLYYYDDRDPDQIINGDFFHYEEGRLSGIQLRTAFHLFFIPGISIFAGLEASFYKKWIIPPLAIPGTDPEENLTFPQHEINLNSLRFKAGISIYL